MKKIFMLLFILIGINNTKAQSYIKMIDTTNIWDVYCGGITTNGVDGRYTDILQFRGDTIINDTTYYKLYDMVYYTYNDSLLHCICPLREDTLQQRIYRRNDPLAATTENLLFDFSIIPGDSIITTTVYTTIIGYDKLDSIKSIFFANKLRRFFYFSSYYKYFNDFTFQGIKQWIEGIGLVHLNQKIIGPIDNYESTINEVLCFWQAGQMLYQDTSYSTCVIVHLPNGIQERAIKGNINVYPNPTKDNLTIETNSNREQRLEILNFIGQTVYTCIINKKATVNTSAFAKGVYILKLSSDKGTVVRKFVKE